MSVFSFDPSDNETSNVKDVVEFTPAKLSSDVVADVPEVAVEELSEVQRLAKEAAALEAELEAIRASTKDDDDAIRLENEVIVNARETMQKIIEEARARKQEHETKVFDAKRKLREQERLAEIKRRELAQAQANAAAKLKFASDSDKFDQLTANAPWREWALDHQIKGAKILAGVGRALLADKMGLGKTLTSLITADMLQVQRVLVIVPDDVIGNFNREIHHWAPHRTLMTLGKLTKAERDVSIMVMKQMDEFICTINYSAWRKDANLLQAIVDLRFEMVIADEAHTIKSTTTSAYKGVKRIVLSDNSCPKCRAAIYKVDTGDKWSSYYKCALCDWRSDQDSESNFFDRCSVRYVLPMTGTPILNKPQDLFAILSLIDPVQFVELKDYLRTYCQQNWYSGKWEFQSGGLELLTKRLSSMYLARDRKSAGVILPPQTIQIHEVEIDAEIYANQHRIITQLTKGAQILQESGKKMDVLAVIALITRKRQANVWPAGIVLKDENGDVIFNAGDEVQESAKLDYIIDNTTESGLALDLCEGGFENGERVTIFSQFKGPLYALKDRFEAAGISVVMLTGDTPANLREEIKIDFDKKYCDQPGYVKRWQVVLCHFRVGGQGLNFTDSTQMIILDEEWNPGKNDQAYARIDRMGQTRETTVHVLRSPRTIDTWMAALNDEKADMIGGFEQNIDMAQSLMKAMMDGDIL